MPNQLKQNNCCKSSKQKPPRPIPKSTFEIGINLCKENIADFLSEARVVLANDKPHHAYVLFEFALEEFGKILMLKEALAEPNNTSDTAYVPELVFTSHRGKQEKAIGVLGDDFKSLYNGGIWMKGYWLRGYMSGICETEVGHNTRLKCAFVDYLDNDWRNGDKAITKLN